MAATKSSTGRTRPRAALTRARIVQAALELVEAESLQGFSTRKLGDKLGCEAMSIYHYFPSKQHLLDALVEHAISSIDVPQPAADAGEAEARIRHAMHSYRAMARRWPALYQLIAVHRLNMPAGVRFIESILRLVHQATGGDPELTAREFRILGYYLTGAALDETAGYARGPSAAEPVSDTYIAAECPLLTTVAPYFKREQWDATFEYGLESMLRRSREQRLARPPRTKP
jgi:AcrR family transcriptional regulator